MIDRGGRVHLSVTPCPKIIPSISAVRGTARAASRHPRRARRCSWCASASFGVFFRDGSGLWQFETVPVCAACVTERERGRNDTDSRICKGCGETMIASPEWRGRTCRDARNGLAARAPGSPPWSPAPSARRCPSRRVPTRAIAPRRADRPPIVGAEPDDASKGAPGMGRRRRAPGVAGKGPGAER